MAQYLSKFKLAEKFDHLPEQMEIDARGNLRLDKTRIDMIPAGLQGVSCVFLAKKPLYIAPDFRGEVLYYDSNHPIKFMDMLEIKAAKERYAIYRDFVERPRYFKEEDGSLSLASLPNNICIFRNLHAYGCEKYCLDLTRTSITQKQNLGGFQDIILYPKKFIQQEFVFTFPKKVCSHKRESGKKFMEYEKTKSK